MNPATVILAATPSASVVILPILTPTQAAVFVEEVSKKGES